MNRAFVYVCAPRDGFANSRLKNYCRQLYDMGYLPICPHLMFGSFLSEDTPEERENCHAMAMDVLRRCRVLAVCSNELTEDMEKEIFLAKRLGIVTTSLAGIKKTSLQHATNEGMDFAGK